MAFKKGQVYRCGNPDCGCEITVTQAAKQGQSGHDHRCCCGTEMVLKA